MSDADFKKGRIEPVEVDNEVLGHRERMAQRRMREGYYSKEHAEKFICECGCGQPLGYRDDVAGLNGDIYLIGCLDKVKRKAMEAAD